MINLLILRNVLFIFKEGRGVISFISGDPNDNYFINFIFIISHIFHSLLIYVYIYVNIKQNN